MSSSQVQCDLKNTPRDIIAIVKSHAVLPWLGAWGVTGSGHRWYILKSYAPDNMRCWPVKVHIVTWKRCNLSEYNWAFHSKCMGQFSCFANLEINRINPHILHPSEVESWVQACAVQRPCNTKTMPKAQQTRGLSSAYQSNFFRSYHEFFNKSWSNIFKISTKHQQQQHKISTKH